MSILVNILAYDMPEIVNTSKIAILIGSIVAAVTGLLLFRLTLKTQIVDIDNAGEDKVYF